MVNSPDTVLRFMHSLLCSQSKMDSLYLVILHLIIYACSTYGGPIDDDDQALKPCPKITPFKKVNIDQVKTKN